MSCRRFLCIGGDRRQVVLYIDLLKKDFHHEQTENGFFRPIGRASQTLEGWSADQMGRTEGRPQGGETMSLADLNPTSIPSPQIAELHRLGLIWLKKLNRSVPALAPTEWIHARQKLGILCRVTHPTRKPTFMPTPVVFGDISPIDEIATSVTDHVNQLRAWGIPQTDFVFQILDDAAESLSDVVEASISRAEEVEGLQQQLPYIVPVGMIPEMNHFSRWADGDHSEDVQSRFTAGPSPVFPFTRGSFRP